jgi:hypothetical protein
MPLPRRWNDVEVASTPYVKTQGLPGESSNLVKITQFGAGEKLAPFLECELAERAIGIICIAYYDQAALACDLNACPGVTGTRDIPLEITGRRVCWHPSSYHLIN